jgi:hypothetical protein
MAKGFPLKVGDGRSPGLAGLAMTGDLIGREDLLGWRKFGLVERLKGWR